MKTTEHGIENSRDVENIHHMRLMALLQELVREKGYKGAARVLEMDALASIDTFLRRFASRAGWSAASTDRLASAGEETLTILLQEDDEVTAGAPRRLSITARMEGRSAEVDFVTAMEGENLEDRLAYLSELPPVPDEREVSFRLLRHYASSVRHQKYHGVDIVTVSVESTP